jgi:hypothetical protein
MMLPTTEDFFLKPKVVYGLHFGHWQMALEGKIFVVCPFPWTLQQPIPVLFSKRVY